MKPNPIPPSVEALQETLNRAVQLHSSGQFEEAESIYQKILSKVPEHSIALHLSGVIEHQKGAHSTAIDLIERSISNNPLYFEAHVNLGGVYKAVGRLEDAAHVYTKALAINPRSLEGHFELALTLQKLERLEEAACHYQSALTLKPDYFEAQNNLGNVYKALERFSEAETCYRKVIEFRPDIAEVYNNLGIVLTAQGAEDAALICFEQAVEINPAYSETLCNMGKALYGVEKYDEAIDCYHRAALIDPNSVDVNYNLGVIYSFIGQCDEALVYYKKVLDVEPDHKDVNLSVSMIYLFQAQFELGWDTYKWRNFKNPATHRTFDIPLWTGEDLRGKRLYVYGEQGIGDEVSFSSCLRDLSGLGASAIYLDCDPRLEPLIARSFPELTVRGKPQDNDLNWIERSDELDYAIAIGSLGKFFRNRVEDFPTDEGYLVADSGRVEEWRERLAGLGDGLKVGISWRGGKEAHIAKQASIDLVDWKGLLLTDALFVNLQYGDTSAEIAGLGAEVGTKLHTFEDLDCYRDLDELAALITALDLVITIDNATLHMAGSLGTAVWGLLGTPPDWRWSEVYGERSPYYPSLRLYRQGVRGEWEGVFKQVERSLHEHLTRQEQPHHFGLTGTTERGTET